MYDGSKTTAEYNPIRWIVGKKPVEFKLKQLKPIAKTARPLQQLDGRIILFSN